MSPLRLVHGIGATPMRGPHTLGRGAESQTTMQRHSGAVPLVSLWQVIELGCRGSQNNSASTEFVG